MPERRRIIRSETLQERLAAEAKRLREEAKKLNPGAERDALLRLARQAETGSIDYAESGCSGWFTYEPVETVLAHAQTGRPAPLEHAIQPFFIGLAISLGCGAVTYLGFWMIGWLCAGFTRD